MQKKILALAVAGLLSGTALAQSNVTIYGRFDYGFVSESGGSGNFNPTRSTKRFNSGILGGSRVGFKGSEDLGNGLKAVFQMEFGTSLDANDDSGGLHALRNSHVGLAGDFGTVVGGRLNGVRYGIYNKYDAFGGGSVGNFTQMTSQVDRAGNAIAYISPSFSGMTLVLAYATHAAGAFNVINGAGTNGTHEENNGNESDAELNTIMLAYENGPIKFNLDYETVKEKNPAANTTKEKVTVTTIGGSYDLGVVDIRALWDNLELDSAGTKAADQDSWLISAKAPMGNIDLKATYGKTEDKTGSNGPEATKFGIGVDYKLSKRTMIYADYGKIKNKNGGMYTISEAANGYGDPITNDYVGGGRGVKGIDVGIAHTF